LVKETLSFCFLLSNKNNNSWFIITCTK